MELRNLLWRIKKQGEPARRAQDIWGKAPPEAAAVVPACGDCYGAARGAGDCCDTCQDVLVRYSERRWGIDPASVAQCNGGAKPGEPTCGDAPGAKPGVPKAVTCAKHLACGSCVADGCGWCISQRACRPDEPWLCQVRCYSGLGVKENI
jgi:hypothetical protein